MDKTKRNLIILAIILNAIEITLSSLLIGYVKPLIYSLFFSAIAILIVVFSIALNQKIEWLYKLIITIYYISIVITALYLIIIRTGFVNQFYNEFGELDAQLIANAIKGKKSAVLIFISLSFLQVTFLPVPSVIMTVVGAALFGIGKGIIYSLIGQLLGSMVAFWLGKIFGKRIIIWMVGQDAYDKYNNIIRGRDKIVIVFMLLFPFFPDDLLCMFAGLTTFTGLTFFFIIFITRLITITYTSFGYGLLDVIKSLGVWSYVIYIVFALIVLTILYFVWKRGDVIEDKMLQFIDKITPKKFKKNMASNELIQTELPDVSEQDNTIEEKNEKPFSDDL